MDFFFFQFPQCQSCPKTEIPWFQEAVSSICQDIMTVPYSFTWLYSPHPPILPALPLLVCTPTRDLTWRTARFHSQVSFLNVNVEMGIQPLVERAHPSCTRSQVRPLDSCTPRFLMLKTTSTWSSTWKVWKALVSSEVRHHLLGLQVSHLLSVFESLLSVMGPTAAASFTLWQPGCHASAVRLEVGRGLLVFFFDV